MRTFLHTMRVLCYICAFISLFCGSSLIGGVEGTLPELFIDLGMAAFFALLGLIFSYLRTFVCKPSDNKDKRK